jgi:hypothetical protein
MKKTGGESEDAGRMRRITVALVAILEQIKLLSPLNPPLYLTLPSISKFKFLWYSR